MFNFITKENLSGANDSRTSTKAGAKEQNSRNDELKTAVSSTGQILTDYSTQVDTNTQQLAKAAGIYGRGAATMQDNGTVNTVQLTPFTGSSGLRVPSASDGGYDLFNGARISFLPAFANTGNVTINIGQTTGTLLGAKKALQLDGSELDPATIGNDRFAEFIYSSFLDGGNGAFVYLPYVQPNAETNYTRQQFFERVTSSSTSGTISWDMRTQQNMHVTLTGDATLALANNFSNGSNGEILFTQDATGGHTLSFASEYVANRTGGDLPEIEVGPNDETLLVFSAISGSKIVVAG